MARRPLHLRWIYVKDHALLFSALLAAFLAAAVVSALLANDPLRGLLLGMVPTLFAVVVWALTNRAGYSNRGPVTLAHERPQLPANPGGAGNEAQTWDPFKDDRRPITQPGSGGAQQPAVSGDPFSPAQPAPIGEKLSSPVPDRTATRRAAQARKSQWGRAPAAGVEGTSSAPGERSTKPTGGGAGPGGSSEVPGRGQPVAGKPKPSAAPSESKPAPKPPAKPGPFQRTSGAPDTPIKAPPAAAPPEAKTVPPEPSEPAHEPTMQEAAGTGKTHSRQTADESSASTPSHRSPAEPIDPPIETPAEYVSPAEAARQAAEARKRSARKRKGKPDEAA